MTADIMIARREHAAASMARRRRIQPREQHAPTTYRPADDDREQHAAEREEIRREHASAAAYGARVDAVRVACNRLIAEGRTITTTALRACGAKGQDRELMNLARDLAVRGLINPHGYNRGRDTRLALPGPAELAIAVGACVEDYRNAWRRLMRPAKPKPKPEEEEDPCSSCPGSPVSPSSSTADGSSSR